MLKQAFIVKVDPLMVWVPEIYEQALVQCVINEVCQRAESGLPPLSLDEMQAARGEMATRFAHAMPLAGNC